MSLLDDVSIVVTPNGYKAGELYAVIPVPTEGSEDVVNGDFASGGTSWNTNTGWTITTGIATSVGATADINQGVWSPNAQSQYQVTFEVKTITAGGVRFRFGGVFGATRTSTGIYTEIITTVDTERIRIASVSVDSSYFSGTITNISVKEYTSADMDVTRATDATRVDENGLVNYAEVIGGELVDNGSFTTDSNWDKTGTWSIESNYATASGNSSSQYIQQDFTITNGKTYLFTYEIIQNTLDGSGSALSGTGGFVQIFLSNVIGTHQVYITADDSGAAYALKIGVSATATTGTIKLDNVSVKEVTRDNVPRIDYTGGGCPHILAEPQRTNLIPYSEDFSQWNQVQDITLTANSTISPSGESNGTKALSTGSSKISKTGLSFTNGVFYTLSVYCKNIDATDLRFFIYMGGLGGDLTNVFTSQVNTSSWTKVSFTFTPTGTTTDGQVQIARSLPNGESAYFWGAQLEEGSYPTSYIPTDGSTVTRNQDIFTRDGIGSLINSTEGVLFAEIAALSDDGVFRIITLSDGGTTNRVSLIYNTVSNSIRVMVVSTSTVFDTSNSVTSTLDFHKIAIKWKLNDFAVWIDGVEVATDTSGATPVGLDRIVFDVGNGTYNFYGKVKQLQVYDTALTDEQLLQLTGESGTDFYESYAEMASALTYTIQ